MAQLKSTVVQGALTVTGNVVANKLIKLGGTDDQILMADGTTSSKSEILGKINAAVTIKGTLGTGGTITSLPTASASNLGYGYKVITAGTYNSVAAKIGDMFICYKNGSSYAWMHIPSGDDIEDTWRPIKLEGNQILANGNTTNALNFKAGTNVSISNSSGTVTFAATDTGATAITTSGSGNAVTGGSYDASSRTITLTKGNSFLPLAGGTLTGTLGFKSNYIIKPVADYRCNDGGKTGAITITLPATIGNTMISLWIDVYNYVADTLFSVHIGGYTYNNSTWTHNPSAMVYGADHKIRLGHNGTNFVIYIGELNSSWSYPQISVRDVILGHNPTYSNWYKDWTISFTTSAFSNVTVTKTDKAWTSKNLDPDDYLTSESDTLQTVTNRGNTTTNAIKIQNGAAAGCLILGGNVGATGLTANTRKLARVTIPDYTSTSKTIAIFSADADSSSLHSIEFGSRQGDSTSYAPNLMSFSVGATTQATDRYNVAQYQYNKIQFFNHESGGSDIKKTPATDLIGMWEFNNGRTFINNGYTYTLPNKTGTIALISDLPTVSGFVTGPSSSTDNAIARYHSTTGKVIQNSSATIDDNGIIKASGFGDGSITIKPQSSNEVNFGGTSTDTTIYFGHRATDSRPKPTIYIFGGTAADASVQANKFIKTNSSDSYVLLGGGGHKSVSDFQISGDYVEGPASATDSAIARYDGTTGKVIQNSNATLDNDGNITLNGNIYGPQKGSNPRNIYGSNFYFFNCNASTTSNYNFGLYQWNDVFQFTTRTSSNNTYKATAFEIEGSDGTTVFKKAIQTPGVVHSTLSPASGKTKDSYVLLAGGGTKALSDFAMDTEIPTVNNGTLTMSTSGTGVSGSATFTANQSTSSTFTVTLDSSAAGNRGANKVVLAKAAGQIDSDKFTVTSAGATKSTIQYNTTEGCLEFVFA